jgi:hypothetical protein
LQWTFLNNVSCGCNRPANVPEGATVQWEIELLGFEMPKDWTGLTFNEIMDEADKIKNTVY